ncbi:carbohydrate-binding protein SusD [Tamlana nanhaiensis]|uniref:Carbohydrate-binding protein SusD n=1 Tax=Neotamlana nanhaiensis TaxID=1382798 RepID=A0A0D7VZH8_9FLAO|nr:RagB/SusD family nutrient uptake outer membrane protein [Tamlana nanhaiensis]KJD32052.1 carbohydrate-binding protein SusD [Tamlana nanhaiensis]KJD32214.1 carbohydrate-binding protein SusD [Tamlana nanhaiensis]
MKNKFIIAILSVCTLLNYNCTDLDEQVLDESLTGTDGATEPVSGALSAAYGNMAQTFRHTRYFGLVELATDEAILPPRNGNNGAGTQWQDGDRYVGLHTHNFPTANSLVGESWDYLTTNISRTVTGIESLVPLAEAGDSEAQAAVYELRALRAYFNMLVLDAWGIAFKKEASNETSEILKGQDAVDYIESEFSAVVNDISDNIGPGRITQSAVYGFLAKLHLNAAVYRDPYGTPNFTDADMDKVIEYTNNVINSQKFSISPEYFDLFNDENHDNPELIFAVDLRGVLNNDHNRWAYWSMSGSLFPRPDEYYRSMDGTDGPAITSDFYQTWVEAYGSEDPSRDARFYQKNAMVPAELEDLTGLNPTNDADHYYCVGDEDGDGINDFEMDRGILRGTIWAPRKIDFNRSNGSMQCDEGYRIYPLAEIRENGNGGVTYYVDHTENIDFSPTIGYASGYRVAKWQFSKTSDDGNNYSSVDLVLLRYADIYLMRAEAKLRKGDATALDDVNYVRAQRTARPEQTPPALASLDLDVLYRERGFEFYWEMARRTDMIRFGRFEDTYTEKTDTDVNHRLFPIPQNAIDGASNVPGYLEQNQGY